MQKVIVHCIVKSSALPQKHKAFYQYRGILVDVLHQNAMLKASNRRPIYPCIGRSFDVNHNGSTS
jgi:hypothetical protein